MTSVKEFTDITTNSVTHDHIHQLQASGTKSDISKPLEANHELANENSEISPSIDKLLELLWQLKSSLHKLEIAQLSIQNDFNTIKADHEKAHREYDAINHARLEVIEKQKAAILRYKLTTTSGLIKSLLRPMLGNLYHHDPRRLFIPSSYNKIPQRDYSQTISIVTPSFNQGQYIERTMLSVLNQQYPFLEYIVQDGGSNDETVDIIQRYESKLKHWQSAPDKGQSNAINIGFEHSTGEIMAYLNSDDILLPGTLHYISNYFENNPDVDVVYGHRILINEDDHEIGRWVLPPHDSKVLTWADYIPQETLFWRRTIWNKVGGNIDESFKFAMDWELLLRFKEAGAVFARLPRFLGAFRVHLNQKSSNQINDIGKNEMSRLRLLCHGRKVTTHEIKRHTFPYLLKHIFYHRLYKFGIIKY